MDSAFYALVLFYTKKHHSSIAFIIWSIVESLLPPRLLKGGEGAKGRNFQKRVTWGVPSKGGVDVEMGGGGFASCFITLQFNCIYFVCGKK